WTPAELPIAPENIIAVGCVGGIPGCRRNGTGDKARGAIPHADHEPCGAVGLRALAERVGLCRLNLEASAAAGVVAWEVARVEGVVVPPVTRVTAALSLAVRLREEDCLGGSVWERGGHPLCGIQAARVVIPGRESEQVDRVAHEGRPWLLCRVAGGPV